MADEAGDQEPSAFSLATSSSHASTRTPSPALEEPPTAAAEAFPEAICQVCFNLGNEVWDPDYRREHRMRPMPIDDVRVAAQKGCPGCEIIAWALEPYMQRIQEEGGEVGISFGNFDPWINATLRYYGKLLSRPPNEHRIELEIKSIPFGSTESSPARSSSSPCPWRFVKSSSMVTCNTGSSAAVEKVQKWYSECLLSHTKCLSGSGSPLPTRIIHIRGLNKANLHISGTEHADYACLSHCWGGQSMIQTTTQSLEQHTVDIPWGELPKTFQDAIQFAHSIGFRYLWIDSLCIIQDSVNDWRHEGSQMSSIYANSSMTLSATRAANPDEGCFARLDERYTSRTKTFTNSDHETYELYCHEKLPDSGTPLAERGWVFQERKLSGRIVHFLDQELSWECRERHRCECGTHAHETLQRDNHGVFEMSELSSLNVIDRIWRQLVETYSLKSLTYPTDIFPAIQALAKLFPSKMGRYLAGHWETTLILSLGWFLFAPARDEHKEWRAPSWSWAAATRGAHVTWLRLDKPPWNEKPITMCATLLSALTVPKGDDPMGQLSYGSITLRGELLAGEVKEPETPDTYGITLEGESIDAFQDCSVYWDRTCHGEVGKQLFALKLYEADSSSDLQQSWLLLEGVRGDKVEYVRIGVFYMRIYASDEDADSQWALWNAIHDKAVEVELKII